MKKILMALMLGVAGLAFAAVAPDTRPQMRRPKIIRPDMTKRPAIPMKAPADEQTDEQDIKELARYRQTLTKDNIDAVENVARLMQDDPAALFGQISGQAPEDSAASNRVSTYQRTPANATPAERLAVLRPPSLMDSIAGGKVSEEEMQRRYQRAVQSVERVAQTQLEQRPFGQKQAPIRQFPTVEDVKNSGIDLSYFPENWEELLKEVHEKQKQDYQKRLQSDSKTRVPVNQK